MKEIAHLRFSPLAYLAHTVGWNMILTGATGEHLRRLLLLLDKLGIEI
jgi:hypothetical protein